MIKTFILLIFIQAIFVDLKPDPVDILGIAKIVRSPTNSSQGPWFYVDARQSPPYLEVRFHFVFQCTSGSYM